MRGVVRNLLSEPHKAILDFDKAIDINQNDSDAYSNRGFAKGLLGNHQEAITDFSKSIELDSNSIFAYMNRGVSRNFLGEYKNAISDFDKSIKLSPYDSKAYNYRGVAKALLENYQEAITDFNMAILLNQNDAEYYSNRGSAKNYLGDYQGAIDDYDNAINLQPDNLLHYHLKGLVFLNAGDKQKADESFMIFSDKKNQLDNEQDKNIISKTKRGKKSHRDQLHQKLNDLPDELSFLKIGRDQIKGKSHHEDVLYLHALLDHAMRNTLCYIAVVNLKCNFEITKEHIKSSRYSIRNFRDILKSAMINISSYPGKGSDVFKDLNLAIVIRDRLAHGKRIGKSSSGSETAKGRWEAISDVTEAQCCKACIYFIDFFIEYLKFFDSNIQNKNKKGDNKFNPFNSNFQGFIGTRGLNEQQTKLILRGIGIIRNDNQSNN
ncbi:MAG: hypothetical protein ISN28_16180 [Ectothiorhodospiraceae bacterium AqS1]|nr:hypothetical protein [Ectothiorhodospiraceae bacterium AqS1]